MDSNPYERFENDGDLHKLSPGAPLRRPGDSVAVRNVRGIAYSLNQTNLNVVSRSSSDVNHYH